MESAVKKMLKSLCCSYGWSYGILWRFDLQNPMFLTLDDAYEDPMEGMINDLLLPVHMLGQGIVGEAALTGKHQWIDSEAHCCDENYVKYAPSQDAEAGSELRDQFAAGIKTIVAIPLESQGVVQFGSTNKIPESLGFVNQVKKIFRENLNVNQVTASATMDCGNYNPDEWFVSLFSDGLSTFKNQAPSPVITADKLIGEICHSQDISCSPPSVSKRHHETTDVACNEPDVVLSDMMSLEQLFPSATTSSSPFAFPQIPVAPSSYSEINRSFRDDSPFATTYNIEEFLDVDNATQFDSGQLMGDQHPELTYSVKSELPESAFTLTESHDELRPATSISAYHLADNVRQWTVPSQKSEVNDIVSTSSCLNKGGPDTVSSQQAQSALSTSIDTFKHDAPANHGNPFANQPQYFEGGKGATLDMRSYPSTMNSCISGISELDAICLSRPRKGLFSELGLEHLLNGTVTNSESVGRCGFEDDCSASKRQKTGLYSIGGGQVQSESFSCLGIKNSSFQPRYGEGKAVNHGLQRDFILKPQAGLWIDDSYSINAESTSLTTSKKPQESTKPVKKRAKPGESTRPRPKDRQQFQDRLGELRKMIPNTGKCSIDTLLDCTIKHMLFLQNVTKYVEKLKRIANYKEQGLVPKPNANGVTWAFELGDQSMICPIKVEDLGHPGQMLIEMVCEDGGAFLEIADTIRGFGLSILNGSMEDRNDKTWAHFIVEAEATRTITRVDVFWSLVQHIQKTSNSCLDSVNHPPKDAIYDTANTQLHNHQSQNLPQPIMADTFR